MYMYTNGLVEQSWVILLVKNRQSDFFLNAELVFDDKLHNFRVFGWTY